ncbi:hypothetical protein ACQCVO_10950 [Bacillus infantis]|uniref:hypothetical protein n=1 Tax=Bacillus infantis TaxID=324767 RepID=UPI003CEBEF59
MNKKYKQKPSIVVRATPEMANWMHPQNEERKKQIQKRVEAAKARFEQRKKHGYVSADPFDVKTKSATHRYLKSK